MIRYAGSAVARALCLMALSLGLASSAVAQSVSGTILGTVTDSTGATVAGAKVTIVNEGTGLTRVLTADSNGEYTAPALPTGHYTITSEMTGFKTVALSNVEVGVDQRVRINIKHEVGAMTESVSVTAETPLIQTSSSELGTTVGSTQIEALPLNGRNFVNLTRPIPGVLRGIPGANIDGDGSLAWRASASFSANGQRPRDNNYMLDGVDNNETWLQTVVIFPSVDALDEFKLQTSTYSAEYGRSLGGVVNLQIKSGTNRLHGSGFEFHRNDAFDANNFFNNRAGRAKPDFKQNQFGGTIGGPVFKDKTFFFGDYQGHRETQGQTSLSTVPTLAMRAGNFSELTRVIYDPTTRPAVPGQHHPGRPHRYRGAQHPDAALSRAEHGRHAAGQRADDQQLSAQPDQDAAGQPVRRQGRPQPVNANNRFFTRYSFQKTHRVQPATLPHGDAGFTFGAGEGNIKAQSLAFNDTHTLGMNWLNEFRFGWSSIKFFMTPIDYGTNPANAVGLPGHQSQRRDVGDDAVDVPEHQEPRPERQPAAHHQPERLPDLRQRDLDQGQAHREERRQPHAALARDPQRRLDHRRLQLQQQHDVELRRPAPPGARSTAPRASTSRASCSGLVNTKNRDLFDADTYTEKRPEYTLYVQDDFRVTNRLTLNLGLRWDVYPPWIEKSTIGSRTSTRRPASSSSPPTTR